MGPPGYLIVCGGSPVVAHWDCVVQAAAASGSGLGGQKCSSDTGCSPLCTPDLHSSELRHAAGKLKSASARRRGAAKDGATDANRLMRRVHGRPFSCWLGGSSRQWSSH
jgi:hypothetical protein